MSGTLSTDLLIVGAGPFGLAMARYARVHGIEHLLVGRPMSFWHEHMPKGMLLRSGIDWHLDPEQELTFERFLDERGSVPEDLHPLPIHVYLEYASWFQRVSGTEVIRDTVRLLETDPDHGFLVKLASGESVCARRVLLALGFHAFRHVPEQLAARLPAGRWSHTRDFVDMASLRGRRVVIIGGRQSAFEWAALLAEAGAAGVDVVHRHPTPEFAESDWSWVPGLLRRLEDDPSWFRSLPPEQRQQIAGRFWQEGRLKLEPWLAPRMPSEIVRSHPNAELAACTEADDSTLRIRLSDGTQLQADHVILATGYRVDMNRLEFLSPGIRGRLADDDGFPRLDETFQSSVGGLFITSMPAARDFGPYMGFTVSVPYTTRIIGRALQAGTAQRAGAVPGAS